MMLPLKSGRQAPAGRFRALLRRVQVRLAARTEGRLADSHPVAIEPYYDASQVHSVPPFELGSSQSMVEVRILCGSFGIKGRRNSLRLFAPCRPLVLCVPPLRQDPNRIDNTVTSESTPPMAFSCISNKNRTLMASSLPFDVHAPSSRCSTSLAGVDKSCY
jgi:hypothetical protein